MIHRDATPAEQVAKAIVAYQDEVAGLRKAIWEALLLTGRFDPDGGTRVPSPGVYTPDIDVLLLEAVKDLRQDLDDTKEIAEDHRVMCPPLED